MTKDEMEELKLYISDAKAAIMNDAGCLDHTLNCTKCSECKKTAICDYFYNLLIDIELQISTMP